MDSTLVKIGRPSGRAMGKTILIWIACSRHPLNLLNLVEVLQPEYANIFDIKYTISRVCGEFVVVDSKGVLSMVHSSARDCLFQNSSLNYHISRESSHQFIFRICITALINGSPRMQAGQMKSQVFLLYVSTSWPFPPGARLRILRSDLSFAVKPSFPELSCAELDIFAFSGWSTACVGSGFAEDG